jgi:hypothetical protein
MSREDIAALALFKVAGEGARGPGNSVEVRKESHPSRREKRRDPSTVALLFLLQKCYR